MSLAWHQRLSYYLLILIFLVYPFALKLCNAAILLFALNWLVWVAREPKKFEWRGWMMWLMIAAYMMTALSLLYSTNLKAALFSLDKKMALLILPLVIGSSPRITNKQFRSLMLVAIGSVALAISICLIAATYRKLMGVPGGFFWKDLTAPLSEFHPTYFSLYINFLAAWLIIYLIENWEKEAFWTTRLAFAVIIFFYSALILLSSKIHLMLAGAIPLIIVICYLNKFQLKFAIPALLLIFSVSALILKGTKAAERFKHINTLSYELDSPVSTFNEFTIRLALAECSWHILKNDPVFGVGAGDVYDELDKIYRKVDYKYGYLDQQNPHNEYLSQWLATGLIGLILMLAILYLMLTTALRKKQYDFLILLILFIITFAVESALERQKGIVLYSLLTSLYVFREKSPVRKYDTK
ncbi:MAG: O-antigen ligase family protein [Chryseosolibacter sp.]